MNNWILTVAAASLVLVGCGRDDGSLSPVRISGEAGATSGAGAGGLEPLGSGGTSTGGSPAACSCTDGVDGEDGAPGTPGVDGVDGVDGSSCSVTQTTTGATVSCDDGTSATLTNGAQGERGADGQSIVGPAGPAGADSTVPGPMGPAGPAGRDGTGCVITQLATGAHIACDTGSATVNNGADGATGPAGADGAGFDSSKMYVVHQWANPDAEALTTGLFGLGADCDAGDVLMSGGCEAYAPNNTPRLMGSYPVVSTTGMPTGWWCRAGGLASTHSLNAYAVCLKVN